MTAAELDAIYTKLAHGNSSGEPIGNPHFVFTPGTLDYTDALFADRGPAAGEPGLTPSSSPTSSIGAHCTPSGAYFSGPGPEATVPPTPAFNSLLELSSGCKLAITWNQSYLEGFANPNNRFIENNRVTDTHSGEPEIAAKKLEEATGGSFTSAKSEGAPPNLYFTHSNGVKELVTEWSYADEATFTVGVGPYAGDWDKVYLNVENEGFIVNAYGQTKSVDGLIRTTAGIVTSDLTMGATLATAIDRWKASYGTGDDSVKNTMNPGVYK